MKLKKPEGSDHCIHDIIFPLGKKHVGYGSNVMHMEMLGLLMVKALMKTLPKDELGEQACGKINNAFIALFKVIVYWLQFGFNYETTYSR